MAMTKERLGEIALLILKQKLREEGIRLKSNFRREAGNEGKKIGVPAKELMEFAELTIREMVDEAFAPES